MRVFEGFLGGFWGVFGGFWGFSGVFGGFRGLFLGDFLGFLWGFLESFWRVFGGFLRDPFKVFCECFMVVLNFFKSFFFE